MPLRVVSVTPRTGQTFSLAGFTVLVGPNNSGKSQTLRDIRDYVVSGSTSRLKILSGVSVELPSETEAQQDLRTLPHNSPEHVRILGVSSDLQNRHEFSPGKDWLTQHFVRASDANYRAELLRNMGTYWIAHLDAESRFRLAAPTETYDTRREAPSNALQAFFSGGKAALDQLREAFRQAFNMDIALDWAAMRTLYLKVGSEFGAIPDARVALDELLRDAQGLADQGDGYKSFAGVVLAMLTFSNRLLLLDEPEAFLHPKQARVLGKWLATHAQTRSAQMIVASHSADFLWGIVSANTGATVIRLNRTDAGTSYRIVPSATTAGLIQSPLLSSQPVLDSLFYGGVAVCEGDPDRAIYQTVAHTLLAANGGEDILFIHSNGKDAIKTPAQLLREAGAPVCVIVDVDILNSANVLQDVIEALTGAVPDPKILDLRARVAKSVEQITEAELFEALRGSIGAWQSQQHTDLRKARRALVSIARQGSKWDAVKAKGINFFEKEARKDVEELIAVLQAIGLFVVPCGQLESWMPLGYAKGQRWSRAALESLHEGKCPDSLLNFVKAIIAFLKPKMMSGSKSE